MLALRNNYYLCARDPLSPIAWDIMDEADIPLPDCRYLGDVFRCIESNTEISGFTFYMTRHLDKLPAYGKNVVVFIYADELSRTPLYADQVLAIFKHYGTKISLKDQLRSKEIYLNLVTWLYGMWINLKRLPNKFLHVLNCLYGTASFEPPVLYSIPLGYHKQVSLDYKPLSCRNIDVFFDGSLSNNFFSWYDFRRYVRSPKCLSRSAMVCELRRFSEAHPQQVVVTAIDSSFAKRNSDTNKYSENMMDTKIALVPRGSTLETYRFFEALRFGCVVVCEKTPAQWYYEDAPVVVVDSWRSLQGILEELINDVSLMEKLSLDSLEYWGEKLQPAAIAKFVDHKLRTLQS